MSARSHATGLFLATFSVASILSAATAAEAPPPPDGWHKPASATELALDAIIKRVDKDDDQMYKIRRARDKVKTRGGVDYATLLTQPLLAAIAQAEAAEVKKNCGGKYIRGELCGLDYDPVTCAQDYNDTYLYRTEQEGPLEARIAYTWPNDTANPAAIYHLIRQGDRWMIDGIACYGSASFNMK
jgi:hypothetical protein